MKNFSLNSDKPLAPGDTIAVQIAPFGEFPGLLHSANADEKPKRFVQVLDRAAFDRILAAWNAKGSPEILVDADHTSADGGSTRAFGWASNLRVEDGGLFADFKLTDAGARAVNGREYRFVSPVFDCGDGGAVNALSSVALTNRPNLPVRCVLNSSGAGDVNVEDRKGKSMEKIIAALGLAAGASEDEAVAAIADLKKRADGAEAKVLENEAQACAEENKDKVENREAFVKLYVKNGRETALAFLACTKASAPEKPAPQTVLNAKPATAPQVKNSYEEGLAKCRNAAERVAYVTAHCGEFNK